MFRSIFSLCTTLAFALTLAACATPGTQSTEVMLREGVIEQITAVQMQPNSQIGVGAVAGGLVGLGLGSLIGGGTGRDVAMVLGTVGGAYAGNEIQKKNEQPVAGQQIIVRTSTGVLVSVTQPLNPGLVVGQRVYVQGDGDGARVVAR